MPKTASMRSLKGLIPVCFFMCLPLAAACQSSPPEPTADPKPTTSATAQIPDPPEMISEELKPGEGDRAVQKGDKIKVNYVGRLLRTNFKFDSNEGKKPFEFTVGEGVIEGWSEGVLGMKKGGKRKLTIPSRLAYKEKGQPPKIPASAPLVFEVELLGWSDEDKPADAGVSDAGDTGDAGAADAGAKKDDKKKDDKKSDKKPDAPKPPPPTPKPG